MDDLVSMQLSVERLDASRYGDFFRLHTEEKGGLCFCSAWWVPVWDGWSERSAEENRAVREALRARGEYDGYLLYSGNRPVGWCQAVQRDQMEKVVRQFGRPLNPDVWAITCFYILPEYRRRGLASFLLAEVLCDLKDRGVRCVEAYPKYGDRCDAADLWNGPEQMFLDAGFAVVGEASPRRILTLDLAPLDCIPRDLIL